MRRIVEHNDLVKLFPDRRNNVNVERFVTVTRLEYSRAAVNMTNAQLRNKASNVLRKSRIHLSVGAKSIDTFSVNLYPYQRTLRLIDPPPFQLP